MKHKNNVLVVEDEDTMRETLYYNLTGAGYNVITAENGRDALEKIKSHRFRAVLSDIVMDGGDGIRLTKAVKKEYRYLPVILLSGYNSMNSSLNPAEIGAFAYFKKPFPFDKLRDSLEKAIDHYKDEKKKKILLHKIKKDLLNLKNANKFYEDGIQKNDIDILADSNNFHLLNRWGTHPKNVNKKVGISIFSKNYIFKNNITNLLKFENFENFSVFENFNLNFLKLSSIIIIDIEHYSETFFDEYKKLIELNPKIRIIAVVNKGNVELKNKLKKCNIRIILERPVRFDRLREIISYQSTLTKNDEINKSIELRKPLKPSKSNILGTMYKALSFASCFFVFAVCLFIIISMVNIFL